MRDALLHQPSAKDLAGLAPMTLRHLQHGRVAEQAAVPEPAVGLHVDPLAPEEEQRLHTIEQWVDFNLIHHRLDEDAGVRHELQIVLYGVVADAQVPDPSLDDKRLERFVCLDVFSPRHWPVYQVHVKNANT